MFSSIKTRIFKSVITSLAKQLPQPVEPNVVQEPAAKSHESEAETGLSRELLAKLFLKGEGIEIGALHSPVPVTASIRVKYVDRMSTAQLLKHYPELASLTLVEPDILDDGERLSSIADESQDFVIANHFIEHCANPIEAFRNMLRVLKVGGILYMAIPDKRFTFDLDRPVTRFEHLLKDYLEGPAWSKQDHFMEFAKLFYQIPETELLSRANYLMQIDYSIHYHVWTQSEMFEMLACLRRELGFDFEVKALLQHGIENLFILEKTSPALEEQAREMARQSLAALRSEVQNNRHGLSVAEGT